MSKQVACNLKIYDANNDALVDTPIVFDFLSSSQESCLSLQETILSVIPNNGTATHFKVVYNDKLVVDGVVTEAKNPDEARSLFVNSTCFKECSTFEMKHFKICETDNPKRLQELFNNEQ